MKEEHKRPPKDLNEYYAEAESGEEFAKVYTQAQIDSKFTGVNNYFARTMKRSDLKVLSGRNAQFTTCDKDYPDNNNLIAT